MLSRKLRELCKAKELVSIYVNLQERDNFQFGRILQADEEFYLLHHIDSMGRDEGITAEAVGDIIRVEKNCQYTRRMEKLMQQYPEVFRDAPSAGENLVDAVLRYAMEEKRVVSIELQGSGENDVVGFVTQAVSGTCTVRQLDQTGSYAGETPVLLEEITRISCDTEGERALWQLHKLSQHGTF